MTDCVHHWMIRSPDGPTSVGICRRCGEERAFVNTLDYKVWTANGTAAALRAVKERRELRDTERDAAQGMV